MSLNNLLFTDKERDDETNYDNFEARYYDADIGRFMGVDPLVSEMPEWS
ncbi:MAG: RHS repeat-associated core domain-containing protein [Bacteroidota bacterium]